MGTNEHGRMLKRIHVLEDCRILAKETRIGRLKDKQEGLQGKNAVAREKMLQD